MATTADDKLWANSGDSHLVEPPDLFDSLPEDIRDRMPRSERDPEGAYEIIHIDGQEFRRDLPQGREAPRTGAGAHPVDADPNEMAQRSRRGNDATTRIEDLDQEGIWGEVMYPSLGIWAFNIRTPRVAREGCRVLNEWALDFQRKSPRFVCCASIPLLDVA